MPLIDAGGFELHLQTLGPGPGVPSPALPPVVLLHGLLVGSLATWYFSLAPLLAKRRQVVLYDLRGHGRSGVPARGYAIADHLADLERVLGSCELAGPVVLVGHSFGALIALHQALRAPERVAGLGLVELPLPPSQAGVLPGSAELDPLALLASLPDPVQQAVHQGGRRGRRFLERVRALVEDTDLLAALAAMPDLEDEALAALTMPTLALYGETSSCLSTGERLARVIPGARLERLPGGHFLPVEAPAEVSRVIDGFLHG